MLALRGRVGVTLWPNSCCRERYEPPAIVRSEHTGGATTGEPITLCDGHDVGFVTLTVPILLAGRTR
jgi:hypothetical protein